MRYRVLWWYVTCSTHILLARWVGSGRRVTLPAVCRTLFVRWYSRVAVGEVTFVGGKTSPRVGTMRGEQAHLLCWRESRSSAASVLMTSQAMERRIGPVGVKPRTGQPGVGVKWLFSSIPMCTSDGAVFFHHLGISKTPTITAGLYCGPDF